MIQIFSVVVVIKYEGKPYVVYIRMDKLQVNLETKMVLSGQIGETAFTIKIRKLFVSYHSLSKAISLLVSPNLTGLCTMKSDELINLWIHTAVLYVDWLIWLKKSVCFTSVNTYCRPLLNWTEIWYTNEHSQCGSWDISKCLFYC